MSGTKLQITKILQKIVILLEKTQKQLSVDVLVEINKKIPLKESCYNKVT